MQLGIALEQRAETVDDAGIELRTAQRRSSAIACAGVIAARYGRPPVIAEKASQAAITPRRERDRVAGEPVDVAVPVPALVGRADDLADPAKRGSPPRMRCPISVCWWMNCHSSSVSGPGLRRTSSGIASLPTSCSSAASRSSSSCVAAQAELAADRRRRAGRRPRRARAAPAHARRACGAATRAGSCAPPSI